MEIILYCDGAYSSSRDQGGWAFVVLKDGEKIHSDFFPEKKTTNNRNTNKQGSKANDKTLKIKRR